MDYLFANICLTILANNFKLPSDAYYGPGDDVKTLFFRELSKKDIRKILKHFMK
jgi:hypothetical protein